MPKVPDAGESGAPPSGHNNTDDATAGETSDITMAITYGAATRLAEPRLALAVQWADWLGLVGNVPTPKLQSFIREHDLQVDFFNEGRTEPAERLSQITDGSRFDAERKILVGTNDEERIAAEAEWEFVQFEEAARKAGWEIA